MNRFFATVHSFISVVCMLMSTFSESDDGTLMALAIWNIMMAIYYRLSPDPVKQTTTIVNNGTGFTPTGGGYSAVCCHNDNPDDCPTCRH